MSNLRIIRTFYCNCRDIIYRVFLEAQNILLNFMSSDQSSFGTKKKPLRKVNTVKSGNFFLYFVYSTYESKKRQNYVTKKQRRHSFQWEKNHLFL